MSKITIVTSEAESAVCRPDTIAGSTLLGNGDSVHFLDDGRVLVKTNGEEEFLDKQDPRASALIAQRMKICEAAEFMALWHGLKVGESVRFNDCTYTLQEEPSHPEQRESPIPKTSVPSVGRASL